MQKSVTATLRYLRMSPRKVRLMADLICGTHVADAETQLFFSKKVAAKPLLKLLKSAKANAEHNDHIKVDTLVVKSAIVNGGPIAYRSIPRAFGRASPIRKRTAHITLTLTGDVDDKVPAREKHVEHEKDHDHAVTGEVITTEQTKAEKAVSRTGKKKTKAKK